MVYGDYELIHTKRVNRIRKSRNPLSYRIWEAQGGYSGYFYGITGAAAAYSFGNLKPTDLVPTREILSRPGFRAYLGNAGLRFFLPSLFAYMFGK